MHFSLRLATSFVSALVHPTLSNGDTRVSHFCCVLSEHSEFRRYWRRISGDSLNPSLNPKADTECFSRQSRLKWTHPSAQSSSTSTLENECFSE